MKSLFYLITSLTAMLTACAQQPEAKQATTTMSRVGGSCEGCEAVFESTLPLDQLPSHVVLPANTSSGNMIRISGVVYKADGQTPAPNVVLYVYHTNTEGIYPRKGNENGWGQRHGYIRGWMRTNDKGAYSFESIRPGSYPQSTEPAHIHIIVKEPDRNEYYIDDIVFDDDPHLNATHRNRLRKSGGSGIVSLQKKDDVLIGTRDIVLGKNVRDYQ